MIVVRSVSPGDREQLWELMSKATYGLTTLQISKKQLAERLELSHFAFSRTTEKPAGEPYVFVMEDKSLGKLAGVSSIFSKTGGYEPFYSYRRVNESNYCKLLDRTQTVETLQLSKVHDGPTEIGSLFLDAQYRGQGQGRLLSLLRFTFMAMHRQRFADEVIAELRGAMTDDGISPFWEGLGRKFFDMGFPQADILSTHSKRFIEDWFPKYPIYVNLLPESVRQVMGQVHQNSKPAMEMLKAEGFVQTEMIDIFDGGPTLCCPTDQINAVQRTRRLTIGRIVEWPQVDQGSSQPLPNSVSIVASAGKDFRAVLSPLAVVADSSDELHAVIPPLTAATLSLQIGQQIAATSLYP